MRVYKEFFFEAAHFLPSAPPGHPNARVHGHSFRVRVAVDGEPEKKTGILVHFDDLEDAVADARDALDHRMLNEVEGLAVADARADRHVAVGPLAQSAAGSRRDRGGAR